MKTERFQWLAILAALALSVVATISAARAQEPIATTQFRTGYNGWFTVSVMVNDKGPYDFIIDTGATHSLAFQNLADIQSFPLTGADKRTVFGLSASGEFDPHFLGSISIGDARIDDLTSVILPDWSVSERPQGILGLDFLSKYIVVFDADEETVSFYDPATPPAETRRWRRTKMTANNFGLEADPLYTVDARVGGRRIPFLLDLGASGTLVNFEALKWIIRAKERTALRRFTSAERVNVIDALQQSESAQAIRIRRFRFANTTWYDQVVGVQDAVIFDELGVQAEPFGLFGANLLEERNFALDFSGERFFLGPKKGK